MVGSKRKIAICVSNWSAESTLYSWTYTKQYLLRRQHAPGGASLHPGDELFIVHVHGAKQGAGKKTSWQAGGALMHSLQDSLERYTHSIVELTGSNVTAATLDWAEQVGLDILVMGFRDAKVKAAMTKVIPGEWGLGSVSGRTLQHTKVPLLIVRPDAALKLNKLRIQSAASGTAPAPLPAVSEQEAATGAAAERALSLGHQSVPALVRTLSPGRLATYAPSPERRVGLAFETENAGRHLLQWAASHLLQSTDQVYVVRVTSKPVGAGAGFEAALTSSHKSETQQPLSPLSPRGDDDPAGDELNNFDVALNTQLRGDPREKICAFAKEEGLDLLVVGRSMGSRFRKAFTPGGTVSQYVVSNAACPVLVYPAKAHGSHSPDELSPRDRRGSQDQPSRLGSAGGGSMPAVAAAALPSSVSQGGNVSQGGGSGTAVEVRKLKAALAARDVEIEELKEQVRRLQLDKQSAAAGAEAAPALAEPPTPPSS